MIGTTTDLPDEERDFLESTAETLAAEVFDDARGRGTLPRPRPERRTRGRLADRDAAGVAAELLGVVIPERDSGAGGTYVATVPATQALGHVGCIQHACQVSITQHAGGMLHANGNDPLTETCLEPPLAGEHVIAKACREPAVGTDLPQLQTRATRDGQGWVIDGEKQFSDFAGYADFMIGPARTSGDDGVRDGFSLFIVDVDADRYPVLDPQSEGWHGFRASDACWSEFDDLRVPAANMLGEEGDAWDYLAGRPKLEHCNIPDTA